MSKISIQTDADGFITVRAFREISGENWIVTDESEWPEYRDFGETIKLPKDATNWRFYYLPETADNVPLTDHNDIPSNGEFHSSSTETIGVVFEQ